MDELFSYLSSLPEEFKRTACFGFVGVILPLAFGTRRVILPLGNLVLGGSWRPFSPNFITLYSLGLNLAGIALFFLGFPALGVGLGGFGAMLDRLDGRMAHVQDRSIAAPDKWGRRKGVFRAQGIEAKQPVDFVIRDESAFGRWWFEMNFAGGTDLGKVLDPAADKVKTLVLFVLFALHGLLWWPLVAVHTVPELVGTLMRRPFFLLARYQKEAKATAVGKWKAVVQWIVVIVCLLFYQRWFVDGIGPGAQRLIADAVLVLATVMAAMSVASRLTLVRESDTFKDALKTIDSSLSHD